MKLSNFDTKGTLQNVTLTQSGTGFKESYFDVDGVQDVWGSLKRMSGSRRNDRGEVVFMNGYEWTVRAHSLLEENIRRGSRWLIDGVAYYVEGYEDMDSKYYRFTLKARE